jgi:hemin uptake protein HemP
MHETNRSSTLSVRRPAGSSSSSAPRSDSAADAQQTAKAPAKSAPAAAPANGERVLRSDALLQGRSHVSIMHNGETYQLRATRLGKLILTK